MFFGTVFHEGMSFQRLIMEHIAPGLGSIIATLMFLSPLRAVLQIRTTKNLGDFNPLPLVAIIANCTGWLLYGCIKADPYIIAANEPGLLLGVFMAVSCYAFADAKLRDLMLLALMFFSGLLSGMGIIIAVWVEEQRQAAMFAGYTAVFILLCYYAAPLSTMADVLRCRSSASLYWPSAFMNTLNGLLWVAYGTAKRDAFVFLPNGIGATFGLIQLALIASFPAKRCAARGSEATAAAAGAADTDEYAPLQGDHDHPV